MQLQKEKCAGGQVLSVRRQEVNATLLNSPKTEENRPRAKDPPWPPKWLLEENFLLSCFQWWNRGQSGPATDLKPGLVTGAIRGCLEKKKSHQVFAFLKIQTKKNARVQRQDKQSGRRAELCLNMDASLQGRGRIQMFPVVPQLGIHRYRTLQRGVARAQATAITVETPVLSQCEENRAWWERASPRRMTHTIRRLPTPGAGVCFTCTLGRKACLCKMCNGLFPTNGFVDSQKTSVS